MKKSVPIIATFLLAFASSSFAAPITFNDSSIRWPDWGTTNYINKDTVGTPDIKGGKAEVSASGILSSVTFDYTNSAYYSSYNPALSAGDLFIDVGSNGSWDYVVVGSTTYGTSGTSRNVALGTIYSFGPTAFARNSNSSNYILSWGSPGFVIRQNHPVLYNNVASNLHSSVSSNTATVTNAFNSQTINSPLSFSFSNLNLNVGGDFTIGWTVSCANDVIYEKITASVPEPATLLLLGSGLLGLVGFRSKARKS